LLADVLLNFGFVRRFFRLKEDYNQTNTGYIISASLLLGALFWVTDSVLGSLVFHAESSFLDLLALNIPPYEVYVRTFVILACLVGGLLSSKLLRGQRESDRALQESEEHYRNTMDASLAGIYIVQDLVFKYVNPTMAKLHGYEPEEIGNRLGPLDLIVPEQRDMVRRNFSRRAKGEPGKPYEVKAYRKDGSSFDAMVWGNPVTYRGQPASVGTLIDITERRRAEAKLKHTVADLERSNAELEQFAYVASHDLQEPLRMVSSYVQLLAQRYKGQLDADADDFIAYAVDGANRMQALINDLLTYSRVGTRGKPPEPTDCEAVLDQALANLQVAIEESGAVVTHDGLPTVMADDSQLVQLFQNLIDNGIKFRSEGPPRVHVSAKRLPLPQAGEGRGGGGSEWAFSVRDNGIGIDPEFFERIFIIFQRLHSREEHPGTGIGLAICKKIVERHGGDIWVESEPGKGSTFFFTMRSET